MSRSETLKEIGRLLDGICFTCEKRADLYRQYRSTFARIDGYCNNCCPIGKQLQELGRELIKESPERRNTRGHTITRSL